MSLTEKRLHRTIEKIRKIDEIIDFARSGIQLDILLLMKSNTPTGITEISEKIDANRRTIVDAIQKLKTKGLVKILQKGEYILTDKGAELQKQIFSLSEPNIYRCFQAVRLLLIMVTAGTKEVKVVEDGKEYKEYRPVWLSLKELSEMSSIPPDTIKEIMTTILIPSGCVQEKILEDDLVDYKLTPKGLLLARNILYDLGYSYFAAKALTAIVGEYDPLKALKKYFSLYAVLTFVTILTAPLYPWHLIPFIFWMIITAYTAAILIIHVKGT